MNLRIRFSRTIRITTLKGNLLFLAFLVPFLLQAQHPLYHPSSSSGILGSNTSHIGIGTSSPSAVLDMSISSSNTASSLLRITQPYMYQAQQNLPGSAFELRKATNVSGVYDYHIFTSQNGQTGFGTNSPMGLLDVHGGGNATAALWVKSHQTTPNQGGILHYQVKPIPQNETKYAWQQVGQGTENLGGRMEFHYVDLSDPSSKVAENIMVLKNIERSQQSTGALGINTDAPTAALDVNGAEGINIQRSFDSDGSASSFANTQVRMSISSNLGPKGMRVQTTPDSWATKIDALFIANDGRVGIGTTQPATNAALSVNGMIECEELEVQLFTNWPDYVFSGDYHLRSLGEVKGFIKENGHLPDVPSAADMEENGINVAEMNAILMQKVEELTLYMFDLEEKNATMQEDLDELKKSIGQ